MSRLGEIENLDEMLERPQEHLAGIAEVAARGWFTATEGERLADVAERVPPDIWAAQGIREQWERVLDTMKGSSQNRHDRSRRMKRAARRLALTLKRRRVQIHARAGAPHSSVRVSKGDV